MAGRVDIKICAKNLVTALAKLNFSTELPTVSTASSIAERCLQLSSICNLSSPTVIALELVSNNSSWNITTFRSSPEPISPPASPTALKREPLPILWLLQELKMNNLTRWWDQGITALSCLKKIECWDSNKNYKTRISIPSTLPAIISMACAVEVYKRT